MPFNPKFQVLVTDVDGTLTSPQNRLHLPAVEAIRKLEDQGIHVVFCSGNIMCSLLTLEFYLGISGPIIAENGGVVMKLGWDKPIILGSKEQPLKALKVLKETFGDRIMEVGDQFYRFTDIAIRRTIDRENLVKTMKENNVEINVLDSGYALHLCDPQVHKAIGVRKAVEKLGYKSEDVLGIGDGQNDIELLQEVGYGIALNNAPQVLKNVADYVTEKSFGEGFIEAVKKFFNID
ncbi:MAG: phosphoglycolate phosphatase [Candidatus Jordarchaeum sp.]|uniref:phosphoglycolate phosphatase n=1 Tax=Candidatus Jordarchaeum sp. TaxID=2823881 RepID=UPI0040496E41